MEHAILLWIQEHVRNDALTGFFRHITRLGDLGIFWIIICLLLFAGAVITQIRNRKTSHSGNPFLRPALTCFLALLSCFLFSNILLKNIVCRVRPYDRLPDLIVLTRKPGDFSFPSGHTAFSFAGAVALLLSVPEKCRRPAILFVILAVLIGFSRIYLGVHYPTDVLAGALIGSLCGWIASVIINRIEDKKRKDR